jgi:uncharacterized protein YgiB involved in biofilm formation
MRKSFTIASLAALVSLTLVACGDQQPAQQAQAAVYSSVADCQSQSPDPGLCQAAFAASQANLPRISSKAECEAQFGYGNCETRRDNGQDVFGPMMAGFIVGSMIDNNNNRRYDPVYRDRDGDYFSGGRSMGYRADTYQDHGRTVYRAPRSVTYSNDNASTPVASPAPVVKRAGFGSTGDKQRTASTVVSAPTVASTGYKASAYAPAKKYTSAAPTASKPSNGWGSTTPSYKASNDNSRPAYKSSGSSYKSSTSGGWGSSSSSSSSSGYKSSGSSYKSSSSGGGYKSSSSSSSSRRR